MTATLPIPATRDPLTPKQRAYGLIICDRDPVDEIAYRDKLAAQAKIERRAQRDGPEPREVKGSKFTARPLVEMGMIHAALPAGRPFTDREVARAVPQMGDKTRTRALAELAALGQAHCRMKAGRVTYEMIAGAHITGDPSPKGEGEYWRAYCKARLAILRQIPARRAALISEIMVESRTYSPLQIRAQVEKLARGGWISAKWKGAALHLRRLRPLPDDPSELRLRKADLEA